MYRCLLTIIALIALLGAGSAEARCIPPEPPYALPDGATASHEAMVEAHAEVREFDADVRSFTVCLELEVKTLLEDPEVDAATKQDLRELLVQRIDAAIDEAEFVVEQFNEQLRLYRERDTP
jgi:hypothetical protein